ncbi:MAG: twin-arginine translocase subunit TatC [Bdellovibrionaceae bacterium]|nr:twin-arginine translocase subunit TatC [Pseudobdellovibrionaceae bacterium]NUM58375.1 twin-arginine translocase subunit TatC [Pseudobdellovibrionaceae bacterium]
MSENQKEHLEHHMTLTEHLRELRKRLINSIWSLLVFTGLAYNYSNEVFSFFRKPIEKYLQGGGLIYTNPLDKFIAHFKLSIVAGIILSCPFWLYQLWLFVAPGLYKKERRYVMGFIALGTSLFVSGFFFSYYVALPMAFEFLFSFGGDQDKPMITIDHYLDFFTQFSLMFGVSFELPLILAILAMLGVVSQKFLIEKGRYAVMILAVVAAIITPPDVMSMTIMLIPLIALYYIGVFLVGFVQKKPVTSAFAPSEKE